MISAEVIRIAKMLEIQAGRRASQQISGQFLSTYKGQGLDFQEVREYTPGDDIRYIDHNVSARFGHPYVKVFNEDKNINLIVVSDLSPSMDFSSTGKSKRDIARELVSLLLLLGNFYHHKTTFIGFSKEIDLFVNLRHGKGEVVKVLSKMINLNYSDMRDKIEPNTNTDYNFLVHFLEKVIKKRGVLFFISDFLGLQDRSIFKRLKSRFNMNIFHVYDEVEKSALPSLPGSGKILLSDMENANKGISAFPNIAEDLQKDFPLSYLPLCVNDFEISSLLKYFNRKKILNRT